MTHLSPFPAHPAPTAARLTTSSEPASPLPLYTQTHRVVSVKPGRAHLRVIKPSFDPDTHAELRLNLECEAVFDAAMAEFEEAMRNECAAEREAFFATLAVR